MTRRIKRNLIVQVDEEIHRMTGESKPYYRLFALDINKIYHCPYCAKRFTTCDPAHELQPEIRNEITSDSSHLTYEAICFDCNKEFRFMLFVGWGLSDNALALEFSVEEVADLS